MNKYWMEFKENPGPRHVSGRCRISTVPTKSIHGPVFMRLCSSKALLQCHTVNVSLQVELNGSFIFTVTFYIFSEDAQE